MARASKLKVYRTPIGFHDAYVAAPSRKAALAAWGSDADLFARGVAEEVTDDTLMAEPLAKPGEVVRRIRGTAAEQFAALPPDPPKPKPKRDAETAPKRRPTPPKRPPRPDRTPLEAAERAVEDARRGFDDDLATLRRKEAELQRRRRTIEEDRDSEIGRLEAAADEARSRYEDAMRRWRR